MSNSGIRGQVLSIRLWLALVAYIRLLGLWRFCQCLTLVLWGHRHATSEKKAANHNETLGLIRVEHSGPAHCGLYLHFLYTASVQGCSFPSCSERGGNVTFRLIMIVLQSPQHFDYQPPPLPHFMPSSSSFLKSRVQLFFGFEV